MACGRHASAHPNGGLLGKLDRSVASLAEFPCSRSSSCSVSISQSLFGSSCSGRSCACGSSSLSSSCRDSSAGSVCTLTWSVGGSNWCWAYSLSSLCVGGTGVGVPNGSDDTSLSSCCRRTLETRRVRSTADPGSGISASLVTSLIIVLS